MSYLLDLVDFCLQSLCVHVYQKKAERGYRDSATLFVCFVCLGSHYLANRAEQKNQGLLGKLHENREIAGE